MDVEFDVLQVVLDVIVCILFENQQVKVIILNRLVRFDSSLVGNNVAQKPISSWPELLKH